MRDTKNPDFGDGVSRNIASQERYDVSYHELKRHLGSVEEIQFRFNACLIVCEGGIWVISHNVRIASLTGAYKSFPQR